MRRGISLFILAFLSASVFAADDYDPLEHINALGVTRVSSPAEYLPLALQWGTVATTNCPEGVAGLTMRDATPSAAEIVMTSNL